MVYQISTYLKFLTKATNQHGVHSPFVFELILHCLYNKKQFTSYSKIKEYRDALLKEKSKISITDFGSGSRIFTSNERSVSSNAKHSGTTTKKAKILFRIVNYFKSNSILELGTSLGMATHAMSLAKSVTKITTIEGCPNISKFTKSKIETLNLNKIEFITGEFSEVIPQVRSFKYDAIFFDGNHQKEATLQYFDQLLPTIKNNSVWIFDDIYWSKDMTKAWEIIKSHPVVSVTVDTFHFGLVFFRKEQAKENFKIRL